MTKQQMENQNYIKNLKIGKLRYFKSDFENIDTALPAALSNAVGNIKVSSNDEKYFIDELNKTTQTLFRIYEDEDEAKEALKNNELLLEEIFCLIRGELYDAFPCVKGNIPEIKKYLNSYDINWTFSDDEEKQYEYKRVLNNLECKPYIKK